MRKWISLLMALLLFAAVPGALAEGAVPFSCEQQGYATLVDPGWQCEWVDGDGVYYHFTDNNMPYVLAWVNATDGRTKDGEAFLDEELPELQALYGKNGGVSLVRHGEFSVAGRPVSAADVQYRNSQGIPICLLIVVDVRDDFTATFRCRYLEDAGRRQVLDALELIDANLRLTGGAEAPAPQAPAPTQDDGARPLTFAVTDVVQGGMVMGRCTAPADFQVQGLSNCSVMTLGAGNPWVLGVTARSPDGTVLLTYTSPRNYMASADGETPDEQFNSDYFTPMLHYMSAAEYCDYCAARLNAGASRITLVEEDTYPGLQSMLRQRENTILQAHDSLLGNVGLTVDGAASTIATRRYRVETNGLTTCFCVTAVTEGVWYTASMPGIYVNIENKYILWDLPCVYTMSCPEANADAGLAAFSAFCATTASDQFLIANRKLSNELWNIITGRGATYGDQYSERVMKEETAKGDDYDEERFTDYLFDQNDYTLSDGSHVKVSTAYDYVYEGDNGTVYYSDSAFAQPGGGTRLSPNR